MLPKKARIKKKNDFKSVFNSGKAYKSNFFILKTAKSGLDFARFGFVVSTKVSKKATVRNAVKRKLALLARKEFEGIKPGNDIVIVVFSKSVGEKTDVLGESFHKLLEQAKLLKD